MAVYSLFFQITKELSLENISRITPSYRRSCAFFKQESAYSEKNAGAYGTPTDLTVTEKNTILVGYFNLRFLALEYSGFKRDFFSPEGIFDSLCCHSETGQSFFLSLKSGSFGF